MKHANMKYNIIMQNKFNYKWALFVKFEIYFD